MFCGFGIGLLKLTKIIYYYSVFTQTKHVDDAPTKAIGLVAARVSLIQPIFCSVAKFVLEVSICIVLE